MSLIPSLISFQNVDQQEEGQLTVAEAGKTLPFVIQRAYWMYDADAVADRGHQVNKTTHHVLVPIKGSISVELEDKQGKRYEFNVSSAKQGVFIPANHWRKVVCSKDSVLLCFASQVYEPADIIRVYGEWKQAD